MQIKLADLKLQQTIFFPELLARTPIKLKNSEFFLIKAINRQDISEFYPANRLWIFGPLNYKLQTIITAASH